MIRLRILVWLIALAALIAPPGMTLHVLAAPAGQAAVECPEHAPPPDPCPDKGTAKHAASTCCPLMAGAVALLSPAAAIEGPPVAASPVAAPAPGLAGRTFTEEPPPPRV